MTCPEQMNTLAVVLAMITFGVVVLGFFAGMFIGYRMALKDQRANERNMI